MPGSIDCPTHDRSLIGKALASAAAMAALCAAHAAAASTIPLPQGALVQIEHDDSHRSRAAGEASAALGDPTRARFEQLSEREIKEIYRVCSREALAGNLDRSEIALCSVAYDVLLNKHFGGNFGALFDWSSALPDAQTE